MERTNDQFADKLQSLTLQKIHSKTNGWVSELAFYNDDLKFVQHIMDRYLMEMVAHENLDEIRECTMRLQTVKSNCDALRTSVTDYQRKLAKSAPGRLTAELTGEHSRILEGMQRFKEDFYAIKKEIFSIADLVLKMEKREKLNLKIERLRDKGFEN